MFCGDTLQKFACRNVFWHLPVNDSCDKCVIGTRAVEIELKEYCLDSCQEETQPRVILIPMDALMSKQNEFQEKYMLLSMHSARVKKISQEIVKHIIHLHEDFSDDFDFLEHYLKTHKNLLLPLFEISDAHIAEMLIQTAEGRLHLYFFLKTYSKLPYKKL